MALGLAIKAENDWRPQVVMHPLLQQPLVKVSTVCTFTGLERFSTNNQ